MGGTWYPDNYFAYIRSPQWATVVRRYFDRHPRRCSGCPAKVGIELHHRTYVRLEAEHESDLVPLCSACHSMVHGIHQMARADLDVVTDLWLRAGQRRGDLSMRRRDALTAVQRKSRLEGARSIPIDSVVRVGPFSYVAKEDSSFVVWSTFGRKPKAVWRGAALDRAHLVSESIDRRAAERLADATTRPPKLSSGLTTKEHGRPLSPSMPNVLQPGRARKPKRSRMSQVPSIKEQLADAWGKRQRTTPESFGHLRNLPSRTRYGDET